VPGLDDLQAHFRDAVVDGKVDVIAPFLAGGRGAMNRLAIHQRNYGTSLVQALLTKFPATAWLAGTSFITVAAARYVRQHPPSAPCIAEYGEAFPEFLARCPGSERMAYLRDFATLEWHVGQVSIAVNRNPLPFDEFAACAVDTLPKTLLTLQGGLRYFQASWPVDHLLQLYITGSAPDVLELSPADVHIEIRGARGEFHFQRLDAGTFIFRQAVFKGQVIGDAAEKALDADPAFEAGQALRSLIGAGAVIGMRTEAHGGDNDND